MIALDVFREPVWQELTWTLLHFLWQGVAVVVVLALLLTLLRISRPRVRYLLCMTAMGVMVLCPIVTFILLQDHADWGAGQARSTPLTEDIEEVVDFGPGLPLEFMEKTLEPTGEVVALPPDPQPSELGIWIRLESHARSLQPYLLAAWVMGVVCLSGRLLLGVAAAGWLRRAREAVPTEIADAVERLSNAVGLRSAGRVFISPRIREAMVVGLFRPMVLLPAAWASGMTPEILEAVIAHELAHIRRWDLWATLLQRLVETLLFYHPAVWWISRRVSSEREKCCDALAVAATGRRVTYARALEKAAAIRLAPTESALGAAFGGRKMAILDRVSHVLGMSTTRKNQRARWWPVGLLVLLTLVAVYRVAFHIPQPVLAEEKTEQVEQPDAKAEKPDADTAAKTFSGKVVDESGKAVVGADVWLSVYLKPDFTVPSVQHVKTDSQGRFTIKVPPTWIAEKRPLSPVAIWAYADGYQLGINRSRELNQLSPGKNVSDMAIQLKPAIDTTFKVLDPVGKPLAGALVQPWNMKNAMPPPELLRRIEARTDTAGRARLTAVGLSDLRELRILDKGFGTHLRSYRYSEHPFPGKHTFRLSPVGRIEGQLIAEKTEWTRGVRMFLTMCEPPDGGPITNSTTSFAEIEPDDQGRFVVPHIAHGYYDFFIDKVNEKFPVRPVVPSIVCVKTGETTILKINMERLVPVRGTVRVEGSKAPIAGTKININYGNGVGNGVLRASCTSDKQGRFTTKVLPGKARVFVNDSSRKLALLDNGKHYDIPNQIEEYELPPFELGPTKSVEGRIVGESGRPFANARISIVHKNNSYGFVKSDAAGRFTLTGVPAKINAAKAEYVFNPDSDQSLEMVTCEVISANPLTIRVKKFTPAEPPQPPPAPPSVWVSPLKKGTADKIYRPGVVSRMTVRGRVLDHTGQPVAKAGIDLVGRNGIGRSQQAAGHTDAQGRFEISGRGKESKAIIVNAPSLFFWKADLPQPGKEAVIRLPQPARLHIRYDIAGGPPQARFRISIHGGKGAANADRWVDVKAGGDGLVIDNLPPGVYDVSRTKKFRSGKTGWNISGVMLDRQLNLKLTPGKTTEYNLVRKTGTPISGQVVGLPEEGVNGVYVYVRDQRVSGEPRCVLEEWKLPTFDGLRLEGNGPFKTERIGPGKYKVVVEAHRKETPEEMILTGGRLPKWIGTATVNVPESGDPPEVRVEMQPYDAKAKTGK